MKLIEMIWLLFALDRSPNRWNEPNFNNVDYYVGIAMIISWICTTEFHSQRLTKPFSLSKWSFVFLIALVNFLFIVVFYTRNTSAIHTQFFSSHFKWQSSFAAFHQCVNNLLRMLLCIKNSFACLHLNTFFKIQNDFLT